MRRIVDVLCLIFWVVFSIIDVYKVWNGIDLNHLWLIVDAFMVAWFIYCVVTDE